MHRKTGGKKKIPREEGGFESIDRKQGHADEGGAKK